jgi:uncharacterized protein
MATPEFRITVVYCAPGIEDLTELAVPAGTTVEQAIGRSGVLQRHAALAAGAMLDVGVWGCRCEPDHAVEDGDRVELYRPLTLDPKEARRLRAEVRRRRAD